MGVAEKFSNCTNDYKRGLPFITTQNTINSLQIRELTLKSVCVAEGIFMKVYSWG